MRKAGLLVTVVVLSLNSTVCNCLILNLGSVRAGYGVGLSKGGPSTPSWALPSCIKVIPMWLELDHLWESGVKPQGASFPETPCPEPLTGVILDHLRLHSFSPSDTTFHCLTHNRVKHFFASVKTLD